MRYGERTVQRKVVDTIMEGFGPSRALNPVYMMALAVKGSSYDTDAKANNLLSGKVVLCSSFART